MFLLFSFVMSLSKEQVSFNFMAAITACSDLGAQEKKICLPMQEPQGTWVRSLGGEDPLEEGMAIHFSILAWRIPQTEEPGGLSL